MDILELKGIFEYELKRKLAQRSRSPIEELRKLISALKFYDFSNSMVLDKDQFIRGVLRTGLCGFNISDLAKVFDLYDPNKTGYINYLNFSRYLYGKEELIPIAGNKEIDDTNAKSDIDSVYIYYSINDGAYQKENMSKYLESLNKEVRKKKISELSFNEYMIDWKITLLNLLNNILHLNINKDTFTQDNTLYHLGFTILFFVIIYYIIYSFYCINKQEDNTNKFYVYIKK